MCGHADDTFRFTSWQTLNDLFGHQGWELDTMRDKIRPRGRFLS